MDRNALSARNQSLADSQIVGTDSEDDGEGAADSRRVSAEDVAIKGRAGLVPFRPSQHFISLRANREASHLFVSCICVCLWQQKSSLSSSGEIGTDAATEVWNTLEQTGAYFARINGR